MQNMFFEREDWKLFRNMGTLPQKAGVPRSKLSMLVCKEITDNALDLGGELYVSTRGQNYKIHFQNDGTAFPESLSDYHEAGTKIRFTLGEMPIDSSWASLAIEYAQGETYRGKTSPYWYTSENFFELFQSYSGSVRELITQFDGCAGGKAGKIAAEYTKTSAAALEFDETEVLLAELRAAVKNVSPERLGRIGKLDGYSGYCKSAGTFKARTVKGEHDAEIAFVLEVYATPSDTPHITVLLNKSPVTGDVNIYHNKNLLSIFGCGLILCVKAKPAVILINIITPYIPIVTDGKEPDLSIISDTIAESIQKAVSRAQKSLPGDVVERKKSQKEVVAACLEQAIAKASGNGEYRFSLRQLYYAVRPYVIKESGKEPDYAYFCTELISSYEAQHGDIPLMYRDERGTLYHPHSGQDIPIGTIAVENYQKPVWTFNKILYIEKKGFFNVLKEKKIPEKYDMALLTSKGYASRAVKDLLDTLGENSEEEITFFCIHDADAYGTTIYDTLQNETKARPGRKVKIINLGLDPEEAVSMGLEIEKAGKTGRKKGVASYIDPEWESWLQDYRVELNAMSTPQFLAWLEGKIRLYDKGKVIPPESTMLESLDHSLQDKLGQKLAAEILEQNHYADQVTQAVRQVKERCGDSQTRLAETVQAELKKEPVNLWKDVIKAVSEDMIKNCRFLN
ncbi:hypothetical protein [Dehalobacter sp.]|uniref:hypothetical protein n=1 Tax=Dehalobacter sp. TaxID=1962289 RepID=UPI00258E3142|nr:hypothetical protein [Dehalobacter sp.]MDJ0304511.1 hypothetical protein [Dehalobacter sp.]